ncbi:TetR/AcrR family transcriptional regulator [Enterovirga aerilata]|uniref:TetR/AcrR family transcriptional regulator n=1 Tax=Enterovirga aerilata TaxID=2730920 RepID=A0A849IAG7_9HYPH|nr:TetR/AcrR family transcriptional regulator [Enterovirga sp. DB1703]NNM70953.1 TetR/AcrR family transcriptional regulator [Enterovirga sp. DB1703]
MSGAVAAPRKPVRRLPPADRRKQIVEAAVAYFAEFGFEGATRGLAERLGVTQPLIYRYFPSKDELIRAVYEEVYLSRWRGEWIELLGRREMPLRERLIAFYEDFARVVFEPQWMRIYMFSGLRGLDINRWWISFVEDHVLRRVCEEVRMMAGLPDPAQAPITAAEIDGYWLFHGGIFYYGVRENVYGIVPQTPLPRFIEMAIDSFLQGFPATVKEAVARQA